MGAAISAGITIAVVVIVLAVVYAMCWGFCAPSRRNNGMVFATPSRPPPAPAPHVTTHPTVITYHPTTVYPSQTATTVVTGPGYPTGPSYNAGSSYPTGSGYPASGSGPTYPAKDPPYNTTYGGARQAPPLYEANVAVPDYQHATKDGKVMRY